MGFPLEVDASWRTEFELAAPRSLQSASAQLLTVCRSALAFLQGTGHGWKRSALVGFSCEMFADLTRLLSPSRTDFAKREFREEEKCARFVLSAT